MRFTTLMISLSLCCTVLVSSSARADRPGVGPPKGAVRGGPVLTVEPSMDRNGADYRIFDLPSPDAGLCLRACADDSRCLAYTYSDPGLVSQQARCFLKNAVRPVSRKAGCTSGTRTGRAAPMGAEQDYSIEPSVDRPGNDYRVFDLQAPDVELCRRACAAEQRCWAYTYADPGLVGPAPRCFLKSAAQAATPKTGCTSGVRGGSSAASTPPAPLEPQPDEPPMVYPPHRPTAPPVHLAPRDCGTGADDPGCQERRDGRAPQDASAWKGMQANLRAERNELSRRDLAVELVGDGLLTAQQFTALLDTIGNELTRLELARSLVPHVVDPQRAIGYGSRFNNSINRREFIEALRSPPAE
jgi:hypothetical protein